MHNYKNLNVWQKAVELSTSIYSLTGDFPHEERYGLISQMRRASISIASNIAEGAGRNSSKEFNQLLSIAYGSCYELSTQLLIAKNLQFFSDSDYVEIDEKITEIQKMIYRLKENLIIT